MTTVLVVDDDPDVLEATRMVLECAGYAVSTAANGDEALHHLHDDLHDDAAPCVILLDLMMPVMNGWEFRAEQMRDPQLADIPVIVVTGIGKAASSKTAHSLGGVCFLEKPVALGELLSTVEHFCHHA